MARRADGWVRLLSPAQRLCRVDSPAPALRADCPSLRIAACRKLQPQLQLAATERDRLAVLRCGANSTIDPKGVALLYMPPVQQRGRQLAEKLGLTDLLSRADKAAAAWQRLFVPAPPEAAPATPPAPAAGDSLNSTPSSPCSGMLGAALGLVAMRGDENTPLLANRPHSFEIEAASPAASPAARALQPAQPK